MSEEGFDDKTRTTNKGKVIYRRRKHRFGASSLLRIATAYNNEVTIKEARITATAIKIRAVFKVAGSLFAHVDDLFDRPVNTSNVEYERIKRIWRSGNDEIVDVISTWIAAQSGSPQLGIVLGTVGRMVNRGMEYLFTGSTDF